MVQQQGGQQGGQGVQGGQPPVRQQSFSYSSQVSNSSQQQRDQI